MGKFKEVPEWKYLRMEKPACANIQGNLCLCVYYSFEEILPFGRKHWCSYFDWYTYFQGTSHMSRRQIQSDIVSKGCVNFKPVMRKL